MKILIRKSDNVVIYAQPDLLLDTEAHGDNWRDPNFNTGNATLTDAILPSGWAGAVWSYIDGVWAIIDQVRNNEILLEKEAVSITQANSIRTSRNQLLSNSDWTQVVDSPVDKAVWATYRQALRDITAQSGFPWTITWPESP